MGQITIEIPQNVNRNHRLVSEKLAKKVLLDYESLGLTPEQILLRFEPAEKIAA